MRCWIWYSRNFKIFPRQVRNQFPRVLEKATKKSKEIITGISKAISVGIFGRECEMNSQKNCLRNLQRNLKKIENRRNYSKAFSKKYFVLILSRISSVIPLNIQNSEKGSAIYLTILNFFDNSLQLHLNIT